MKKNFKWILVAGARPNFMKIGPLFKAIAAYNRKHSRKIAPFLVHTGQHYDKRMSDFFFRDLELPAPDIYLGIGSGSHGYQTGRILIEFEKVILQNRPDLVIVVGDVNSTIACALAAVKLHIPVAHVESGLRSFDRKMPEEINRILTDSVSDFLFTPSADADENLIREGIPPEKIFLVGDIMVDSLLQGLEKARKTDILNRLGLRTKPEVAQTRKSAQAQRGDSVLPYAVLTLHRPANVDNKKVLTRIIRGILKNSSRIPILFPIHPRTRKQIGVFGMESCFAFHPTPELHLEDYHGKKGFLEVIHCFEPFGYLEFLNLMQNARVVLTDSGGIQEETTVMNIPCITLRDTTERPITLTAGTNVLVKDDPERIALEMDKALAGRTKKGVCPEIWDGRTAQRIISILTGTSGPVSAS